MKLKVQNIFISKSNITCMITDTTTFLCQKSAHPYVQHITYKYNYDGKIAQNTRLGEIGVPENKEGNRRQEHGRVYRCESNRVHHQLQAIL